VQATGHEGHGAPAAGAQAGHEGHDTPAPGTQAGHEGHGQAPAKPVKYHCAMHPTYTSDKPGQCPICGMTLVLQKKGEANLSTLKGRASVTVDAERRQLIGLRLGSAEKKKFATTIRAVGRVEANERLLSAVSLKFPGWIERLRVSAVGDVVEKGEPLFDIYSPELLEAQRNYLLAIEAQRQAKEAGASDGTSFADRNVKSARERLLLWDLTEQQIHDLEAAKEPKTHVAIHSKSRGVVTKRTAMQGGYVQPGADLFEIVDLSTVWIKAEVYEYELADLKPGLTAEIQLASQPGKPVEGKIVYIYPTLSEMTRTVSVRLEVPNPEGRLKPGMFSIVSLQVDLGERVVIPDEAILDSGLRQIVFLDAGEGRLLPQEVVAGPRSDGRVAILSGLSGGEKIVVSGTFLVDAESRLKAAVQEQGQPAGHKH
jgi:RND family efflux transporter MFP subunit